MADNGLSPWLIVNDYTKTTVAVASAFLAFTGTLGAHSPQDIRRIWPLYVSWFFLVLAIAAALFAAGRLTGFLRNQRLDPSSFLLPANVSYFALFFAVLLFFVFAMLDLKGANTNEESLRSVQVGRTFTTQLDTSWSRAAPVAVSWNERGRLWEIVLTRGADSAHLSIEPSGMKVVGWRR